VAVQDHAIDLGLSGDSLEAGGTEPGFGEGTGRGPQDLLSAFGTSK
jgi:hypothetical protein